MAKKKKGKKKSKKKADKPVSAEIVENKVIIRKKKDAEKVYQDGNYGKVIEDRGELCLEEALHLMERGKLTVKKGGKKISKKKFHKLACEIDEEFPHKYIVYKDLRNRGLLVRTGFKFGTHFRVYDRGVKLVKGPKSTREHTKWIVHAIPTNYSCSFPELSRAVRLAHNIRASMLWAIVDEEGDVTYLKIERIRP